MKNTFNHWSLWLAAIILLSFPACSDDDPEPTKFEISTLMAGTVDITPAAAATGVPTNAVIKATFTTSVDVPSATNTSFNLKKQGDTNAVPATIAVNGAEVTLTPTATLAPGTSYTLTMTGIKSTDGQTSTATRSFTTAGSAPLPGTIAHWSFDGNTNAVVGNFNPAASIGITYGPDRKNQANSAAVFNGSTSIIEIANGSQLLNANNFSLSFWMKLNSDNNERDHFVMGLGAFHGLGIEVPKTYSLVKIVGRYEWADGTTGANDFVFNGDGKNRTNGGWGAIETEKDLTNAGGVASLIKDKWAHVTFVFNGSTKSRYLFINGELMEKDNFTLLPDGESLKTAKGMKFDSNPEVEDKLAIGFNQSRGGTLWANEPWGGYNIPTSNHFKGSLDEIRIFHTALTEAEVMAMYNSEK